MGGNSCESGSAVEGGDYCWRLTVGDLIFPIYIMPTTTSPAPTFRKDLKCRIHRRFTYVYFVRYLRDNSVNKTNKQIFLLIVKYRDRSLIGAHCEPFFLSIQRNSQVNCIGLITMHCIVKNNNP